MYTWVSPLDAVLWFLKKIIYNVYVGVSIDYREISILPSINLDYTTSYN